MINNTLMPTFNRVLAFDRDLDRLVNWNGKRFFVPSLDVVERADAYLISAELPGVDPASVEISFEANTLTLRLRPLSSSPTISNTARARTMV